MQLVNWEFKKVRRWTIFQRRDACAMWYEKFSDGSEGKRQHTVIFEHGEKLPFINNSQVIVGSNGKSQNFVK
jgi:hypothetical protein